MSPLAQSVVLLASALASQASTDVILRDYLIVGRVGFGGRSVVHRDAVEELIVSGRWAPPTPGERVILPDGSERIWEPATANGDGVLEHPGLVGGYAYAAVEAEEEHVALLEATGHSMVYVNGEPRAGDPYQYGYVRLPVLLRAGTNELLFSAGRGRLTARLVTPEGPVLLDSRDATLPDLRTGEAVNTVGALVLINATDQTLRGHRIQADLGDGPPALTDVPPIPPLSTRKVGFAIVGPARDAVGTCQLTLQVLRGEGRRRRALHSVTVDLRIRGPRETYKRTFRSAIDGSVQYYAVNPCQAAGAGAKPALVLTLHGAGVEAIGQADAYSSKSWAHLVAPTNRRPYGFDWEGWGRLDALEVLALAQAELGTDPARTYLTGHSMGGHGAWQVGLTHPDLFAAVGPSAGWISFRSYRAGPEPPAPDPVHELVLRAGTPGDTFALAENGLWHGVYVLHGDADDNVPVTQARAMRDRLAPFHHDFEYHEEPGAGHWWDDSEEPGSGCVDWAPMFDLFARHARPALEAVREVRFVTASPGVSARCYWATIEAQAKQLQPSQVRLRCDPHLRRFTGTTENVTRLALDVAPLMPGGDVTVALDGQDALTVPWPKDSEPVRLVLDGGRWCVGAPPSGDKNPVRYGGLKAAFDRGVAFVYGTRGTPEENAWAFAKARYDAETFWYRGNASVDVIPDSAFDATAEPDRCVVLYGNEATNAAWAALLGGGPVSVGRGVVRVGQRVLEADDLACLFVRPRPGSDVALVGAVAGTGLVGMRLADRLPIFISGVEYPDVTVVSSRMLSEGPEGLLCAGFLGLDWGVESGEFAWREGR